MCQFQQLYLQHLAAQGFYEESSDDFTEDELREQAAFRCWLLDGVRLQDSTALPSSIALRAMADAFDWEHGELYWWAWPVWSTCALCQPLGAPLCAQCNSYLRYCALSDGWRTTGAYAEI